MSVVFFSKPKTAYEMRISDWSSDVCSSDLGRWRKGEGEMLPLYVGRMIQHYDHRAANVTVNEDNLHNAALSGAVSDEQKRDPDFVPTPQYWVPSGTEQLSDYSGWAI